MSKIRLAVELGLLPNILLQPRERRIDLPELDELGHEPP